MSECRRTNSTRFCTPPTLFQRLFRYGYYQQSNRVSSKAALRQYE